MNIIKQEAKKFASKNICFGLINIDMIKQDFHNLVLPKNNIIIYRGWMLNKTDYICLYSLIKSQGAFLYTNPSNYLLAHHLPNWYPILKDLTPQTIIIKDLANLKVELKKIGWQKYFIKDFVKSLKTSVGSIITDTDDIDILIQEMIKYRGHIEGGICVRKVEDFLLETEKRYFIINNKPYASQKKFDIPDIVYECAKRIKSPFFSVDYIKTKNNQERIVEIGDGQVSDLVGWSVERFVEIWEHQNC